VTAVLVTGGAGYIGSVTSLRLKESGYEVYCLDNLSSGHRDAVPPGVRLVHADLADGETLHRTLADARIDAVIHFAGAIEPSLSMVDPVRFYRENVARSAQLAEALVRHGRIPIVYSSTCAVYGQPARVPVDESTPTVPDSVYGETKLLVERMLGRCWDAYGLPSISLRYFNAAGALPEAGLGADHRHKVHLLTQVMLAALGKVPRVVIHGVDYPTPDGTCIRDYIHVDDLAAAHVLALGSLLECPRSDALNLGVGQGHSVREIIDAAQDVIGASLPCEIGPRRPGDPARVVADAGRARRELGWSPRWLDIHDVVESAWAWHRAHPDGYRF
jgi:UDP-glucose 4-epimerase